MGEGGGRGRGRGREGRGGTEVCTWMQTQLVGGGGETTLVPQLQVLSES